MSNGGEKVMQEAFNARTRSGMCGREGVQMLPLCKELPSHRQNISANASARGDEWVWVWVTGAT